MEIAYDFSAIFPDAPIQCLEKSHLIRFHPRKYWAVQKAIDAMGELSTEAQGLKRVLTTYQKTLDQDEEQRLYLMWHKHESRENVSVLVGILKVGNKKLYLLDSEGKKQYEESPLSVLDFYIHESLQRKGNGHELFEYMLKKENISAWQIAIDRPSDAFLQFLEKFYQLSKPVWQSTNFVIFTQFFEDKKSITKSYNDYDTPRRGGARSDKAATIIQPPPNYRSTSGARRDTASGIIHSNEVSAGPKNVDPNTPLGRKNTRDFGHQSIW